MKSKLQLEEYLKNELVECESLRDKLHDMSLTDERTHVREEISYYRGQINLIRHLLLLINQ